MNTEFNKTEIKRMKFVMLYISFTFECIFHYIQKQMEKQLGVTSSQEQLVSDMVYIYLLITQM